MIVLLPVGIGKHETWKSNERKLKFTIVSKTDMQVDSTLHRGRQLRTTERNAVDTRKLLRKKNHIVYHLLDLPLPFGPTIHTRDDMSSPKFTCWKRVGIVGPYLKLTSRTSKIGGVTMDTSGKEKRTTYSRGRLMSSTFESALSTPLAWAAAACFLERAPVC